MCILYSTEYIFYEIFQNELSSILENSIIGMSAAAHFFMLTFSIRNIFYMK